MLGCEIIKVGPQFRDLFKDPDIFCRGLPKNQSKNIGASGCVTGTQSISYLGNGHFGHGAECLCVLRENRRTRWGDVFPRLLHLTKGDSPKEGQRGGSGEGKCAVSTVNMSGSLLKMSACDGIDSEIFQSCACGNDIGDGVDSPDLMESDIVRGNPVNRPLGHGNPLKDREHPFPDP